MEELEENGRIMKLDWSHEANRLKESKDWRGLIAHCERWIEAEPEDGFAWFALADGYHQLGEYERAIESYRNALEIEPENDLLWLTLGSLYSQTGDSLQAIECYRKAVSINPARMLYIKMLDPSLAQRVSAPSGYKQRSHKLFRWAVLIAIFAGVFYFIKAYWPDGFMLKVIGVFPILFALSCFIQSFRHKDSEIALTQEGMYEAPQKTSRRLRIMSIVFAAIGIALWCL